MEFKYLTSQGPLTLDEITQLDTDPLYQVRASENEGVHPDKRLTLQMDSPIRARVVADLNWMEVKLSDGTTVYVPAARSIQMYGKNWQGTHQYVSVCGIELDSVDNWNIATTNPKQHLKVTSAKSVGTKDWKWMDLNFVDPDAAYVVNSMFFIARKIK